MRGKEGEGRGEEGGRRREGRRGLSSNVAEEAFCLKSAPASNATNYCRSIEFLWLIRQQCNRSPVDLCFYVFIPIYPLSQSGAIGAGRRSVRGYACTCRLIRKPACIDNNVGRNLALGNPSTVVRQFSKFS